MRTCWLVSYDITDPRRLRRVARAVSAVGTRIQHSVYLCQLEPVELLALQACLARLINHALDTVMYQPWCDPDRRATHHFASSAAPVDKIGWII